MVPITWTTLPRLTPAILGVSAGQKGALWIFPEAFPRTRMVCG